MALPSFITQGLTPEKALEELAARRAQRADDHNFDGRLAPRTERRPDATDPLGISACYFTLRFGLAVLAVGFPIVLLVGGGLGTIQKSLSAYYHFSLINPDQYGGGVMRNVFTGALWAIGAFLFLYKGYSRQENIATNVAGLAALGVAVFHMDWPQSDKTVKTVWGALHFTSAAIFFAMIAYVCVFRARDTLKFIDDEATRAR